MNVLSLEIRDGEYWFGGLIDDTLNMPYHKGSAVRLDFVKNHAYNEVNPMLISTLGRYVYCPDYLELTIAGGVLTVKSGGEIESGEEENFVAAWRKMKDGHFSFSGATPDEEMFAKPQYCTWMALGENPTQDKVIEFAKRILNAGLPAGVMIVDDGWSDCHGRYEFSAARFPSPEKMCAELKEMGFTVMLWLTPYVSPDSKEYRRLEREGLLVRKGGEPFIAKWWDGYSACIDFTNPAAAKYFKESVAKLMKMGVAGVKLDGGDARIYEDGLETYAPEGATANGLAEAYGKLAAEFSFSELRSTSKCAGLPSMHRIADRFHAWEDARNGFDGIVKKALVMGLMGYPFICPDMVGGGQIGDIIAGVTEDAELNLRYMEAAALFPAVQFSKPLWKCPKTREIVHKMLDLRAEWVPYILSLVRRAAVTGEPVMRTMFFEYGILPGTLDAFALGDKLVVAPVFKKGQTARAVFLPEGYWTYGPTGEVLEGGKTVTVPAPIDALPYFIKNEGGLK